MIMQIGAFEYKKERSGNPIDKNVCYRPVVNFSGFEINIENERRYKCSAIAAQISFPDRESYIRPEKRTCYATTH